MPFYEYRCDNGHIFEVRQRMSDDQVTSCLTCEAPVQRIFHPVAVHFKGSGFYATDYGKRGGDSTDSDEGKKKGEKKEDGKKEAAATSTGSSEAGSSTAAGSASPAKDSATSST